MDSEPIKGSCLCGKVGYEIYPPFLGFHYCHCPRCQKATGSAYIANLFVPPEQIKWTSGEDKVVRFDLPEARSFSTCFCNICGSAMPHLTRTGKILVVPAGSLDDDPGMHPECSIWWDHRASWFKELDQIPRYGESDNDIQTKTFSLDRDTGLENRLQKQLEFIIEIDKIKNIFRKSLLFDHSRYENDAEHAWHLALMATVLAEYSNDSIDLPKVLKMVLIHDIVEIDAGDVIFYDDSSKDLKAKKEAAAAERIFGILPRDQKQEFIELWQEFENRETPEAKFAAALDRIEPIMQNIMTCGYAWKKNSISKDEVLSKNSTIIKPGSDELWNMVEKLISKAIEQNCLDI